MIRLGLDFGTTFCYAGFESGGQVMPAMSRGEHSGIPSIYYFDHNTGEKLGLEAKPLSITRPQNSVISVKQKYERDFVLDGKEFKGEYILKRLIEDMINDAEKVISETYGQEGDIELVVSRPVDFDLRYQEYITRAIDKITTKKGHKVSVIGIIPEPVAAAISYFGVTPSEGQRILVYDLGGGTFDASIVKSTPNGLTPYDNEDNEGIKLGGDEWDDIIGKWLIKELGGGIWEKEGSKGLIMDYARKLKEGLSKDNTASVDIQLSPIDIRPVTLDRSTFDRLTKPLCDKTIEIVRKLISRNQGKKIDKIIMVGGSSNMPQVQQAVKEAFPNIEILVHKPERAIADGDAIFARKYDLNDNKNKLITLVATHSYGIEYLVDLDTDHNQVVILIKKGTPLPATGTTRSCTVDDDQDYGTYKVYSYNGDKDNTELELDEVGLKQIFRFEHIHNRDLYKGGFIPRGTVTIDSINIDNTGLLTITVKDEDPATGQISVGTCRIEL